MRYTEAIEICDICGKRFCGPSINIHGSYDYIHHTNFSNNISGMFERTKNLSTKKKADAIVKEFFADGNEKISRADAVEFLECFKHYKKCDDTELLQEVFNKIQKQIDGMGLKSERRVAVRTIPEAIEDIKSILNNVERTEECTGETLVDINELADEILTINCYTKEPITNADKIRQMTDDELAEFLFEIEYRRSVFGNGAKWKSKEKTLEYLQEEPRC